MSPPGAAPVPIVAHARLVDLDGDGRPEVVACDMGHGLVLVGDPRVAPATLREIAKVPNPVRAAAVDLDRDGRTDLLVADIGFFMPEDHSKGAVVWLRQTADGTLEKRVLVEKLPRVTDVEAVDVDGDGDLDLLVSAFGLYSRGSLLLSRTARPTGRSRSSSSTCSTRARAPSQVAGRRPRRRRAAGLRGPLRASSTSRSSRS